MSNFAELFKHLAEYFSRWIFILFLSQADCNIAVMLGNSFSPPNAVMVSGLRDCWSLIKGILGSLHGWTCVQFFSMFIRAFTSAEV
jgi:hypothetical protein